MRTFSGWASVVMAGSVLATLPPMLIFIFLQQYFVRGISMSGMKG